jgi:hypothetical protein
MGRIAAQWLNIAPSPQSEILARIPAKFFAKFLVKFPAKFLAEFSARETYAACVTFS